MKWTFNIEQWNAELLLQNINQLHKPLSLRLGFKNCTSVEQITYENSLLLKSSLNKYEQTIKLKKMSVVSVK